MRKRLIVALLMVFLSFAPVYAGHSNAGGYGYCECDNPASHEAPNGLVMDDTQDSAPELGLLLLALTALMLRYKA
jgi:hypothetical protein